MSIVAKNISVNIGQKFLLDNVSVTLNAGEVIGVVGENGAGKTTLINCLSGVHSHHQNISINNKNISQLDHRSLAKTRAVLTQSFELTFPFSVQEVVRLGLSLRNISQTQQYAIVKQCLGKVNAWHLRERNYTTLSGGEKQRVQLARVLAQITYDNDEEKFLFLDEPTSALDLKHQYQTLRMLKALSQKNIGIFIILHDINLAAMYCDRILLLQQGRLLKVGTPTQVLTQQTIKQGFGIDVHILNHPTQNSPIMVNQSF